MYSDEHGFGLLQRNQVARKHFYVNWSFAALHSSCAGTLGRYVRLGSKLGLHSTHRASFYAAYKLVRQQLRVVLPFIWLTSLLTDRNKIKSSTVTNWLGLTLKRLSCARSFVPHTQQDRRAGDFLDHLKPSRGMGKGTVVPGLPFQCGRLKKEHSQVEFHTVKLVRS